jgi:hypothetical protein
MTDDERQELQSKIDLMRGLREEYAVLNGLDADAAAQIARLAEKDAIECANRILQRYASEAPPAP